MFTLIILIAIKVALIGGHIAAKSEIDHGTQYDSGGGHVIVERSILTPESMTSSSSDASDSTLSSIDDDRGNSDNGDSSSSSSSTSSSSSNSNSGSLSSSSLELHRSLIFYPSSIDFGAWSIGTARSHIVTLINKNTNRSVYLSSISGKTPIFYSSFFDDKIVPPQGNTTFNVVFLPRHHGRIETNLFIHTSFGQAKLTVKGEGRECPYRLRSLVGIKAPLNATIKPEIYMYNPHAKPIQILEVYSSGGQFQLELPSGGQEGPQTLWEIPPYTSKPIIRIRFHGMQPGNHSAYIRIKISGGHKGDDNGVKNQSAANNDSINNNSSSSSRSNSDINENSINITINSNKSDGNYDDRTVSNDDDNMDNVLVIPVDIEISSNYGIYLENPIIDFGKIGSNEDHLKILKLNLINSKNGNNLEDDNDDDDEQKMISIIDYELKNIKKKNLIELRQDDDDDNGMKNNDSRSNSDNDDSVLKRRKRKTKLILNPKNIDENTFLKGELIIKTKNLKYEKQDQKTNEDYLMELSLGIYAEIYKGSLDYQKNLTVFITGAKNFTKNEKREFFIKNSYNIPIQIRNITIEYNDTNIFKFFNNLMNTTTNMMMKTIILPNERINLFKIQAINNTVNFKTIIQINTNLTMVNIELIICTGKLKRYTSIDPNNLIKLPNDDILDFGIVPFGDFSNYGFILMTNPNPIPIQLIKWNFTNPRGVYYQSMFMGCAKKTDFISSISSDGVGGDSSYGSSSSSSKSKLKSSSSTLSSTAFTPEEVKGSNDGVDSDDGVNDLSLKQYQKFKQTLPEKFNFCLNLSSTDIAAFELAVQSFNIKSFTGVFKVWTEIEEVATTVKFVTVMGRLEIDQSRLHFGDCFPGKRCSADILIQSTFLKTMRVASITVSVPGLVFEYHTQNGLPEITANSITDIGRIHFDPKSVCGTKCYIPQKNDIEISSSSQKKAINGIGSGGNSDLDFDETELRRRTELYRHFKWNLQKITFTLNTSEIRLFEFNSTVDIIWPKLVKGIQIFPPVEIGQIYNGIIIINNPSSRPLHIQLSLSDPKKAKTTTLSLPLEVVEICVYCYLTDENVFHLIDDYEHIIKPNSFIAIKVQFLSNETGMYSTLLHIKNNLTLYEAVWITAKSVQSQFRFGNRRPGSTTPLLFEVNEKQLNTVCDNIVEYDSNLNDDDNDNHHHHGNHVNMKRKFLNGGSISVKRTFTARNTGEVPISIETFLIGGSAGNHDGRQCEGYGFKITDCGQFELKSNSSKKIEIQFTPDFTMAKLTKLLIVKTNLSYNVNYTLLATIPYSYLEQCSKLLQRPFWEQHMKRMFIGMLAIAFIIVIIASYFDSGKVLQDHVQNMSKDKGPLQPPLDLRSIGLKANLATSGGLITSTMNTSSTAALSSNSSSSSSILSSTTLSSSSSSVLNDDNFNNANYNTNGAINHDKHNQIFKMNSLTFNSTINNSNNVKKRNSKRNNNCVQTNSTNSTLNHRVGGNDKLSSASSSSSSSSAWAEELAKKLNSNSTTTTTTTTTTATTQSASSTSSASSNSSGYVSSSHNNKNNHNSSSSSSSSTVSSTTIPNKTISKEDKLSTSSTKKSSLRDNQNDHNNSSSSFSIDKNSNLDSNSNCKNEMTTPSRMETIQNTEIKKPKLSLKKSKSSNASNNTTTTTTFSSTSNSNSPLNQSKSSMVDYNQNTQNTSYSIEKQGRIQSSSIKDHQQKQKPIVETSSPMEKKVTTSQTPNSLHQNHQNQQQQSQSVSQNSQNILNHNENSPQMKSTLSTNQRKYGKTPGRERKKDGHNNSNSSTPVPSSSKRNDRKQQKQAQQTNTKLKSSAFQFSSPLQQQPQQQKSSLNSRASAQCSGNSGIGVGSSRSHVWDQNRQISFSHVVAQNIPNGGLDNISGGNVGVVNKSTNLIKQPSYYHHQHHHFYYNNKSNNQKPTTTTTTTSVPSLSPSSSSSLNNELMAITTEHDWNEADLKNHETFGTDAMIMDTKRNSIDLGPIGTRKSPSLTPVWEPLSPTGIPSSSSSSPVVILPSPYKVSTSSSASFFNNFSIGGSNNNNNNVNFDYASDNQYGDNSSNLYHIFEENKKRQMEASNNMILSLIQQSKFNTPSVMLPNNLTMRQQNDWLEKEHRFWTPMGYQNDQNAAREYLMDHMNVWRQQTVPTSSVRPPPGLGLPKQQQQQQHQQEDTSLNHQQQQQMCMLLSSQLTQSPQRPSSSPSSTSPSTVIGTPPTVTAVAAVNRNSELRSNSAVNANNQQQQSIDDSVPFDPFKTISSIWSSSWHNNNNNNNSNTNN